MCGTELVNFPEDVQRVEHPHAVFELTLQDLQRFIAAPVADVSELAMHWASHMHLSFTINLIAACAVSTLALP